MTEKEMFGAIEQINKEKQELLNSDEYSLGASLKKYLGFLKKLDFFGFIKSYLNARRGLKVIRKYKNKQCEDKEVIYKEIPRNTKIAVYTCVTGNYDNIHTPLVKLENVDYYLLVDDYDKYKQYSSSFIVKQLPKEVINKGNILANRYAKFHPLDFFDDYDYSIYIDGGVRVVSDLRKIVSVCKEKTGLAMYRHSNRDDVYDEADVCLLLNRGNKDLIKKQIDRYRKEGFPSSYGLFEATLIASDLKNKNSKLLLDAWWEELIDSGSLRDQLALPYVLWKNNLSANDVGYLGNNVYDNYALDFYLHK